MAESDSGALQPLHVPFMDIQPNWDGVMRDPNGKFWISCRKHGETSIQGHLQKLRDTPAASRDQSDREGKFVIRDSSQRTVTVECPQAQCITTFVRPMKTLHLHHKKLLCMDVSSSGGLGMSSSEDGKLWVWDADTGETRRSLDGHVGDVYTCRYFPSGIVVLSAGADLRLKIWSAQDGTCARTLIGHRRGITDTAIIDRGRNIISSSSDGTARLWDCGSSQCLATLADLNSPINACALASSVLVAEKNTIPPTEPECGTSDKVLLLACDDGALHACDIRNRTTILRYSDGKCPLASCAFITDTTAVCGSDNGCMTLLDLRKSDQALLKASFNSSTVTSLLPLGENRCVAGCSDGGCLVWNIQDPLDRVSKLTGPELDGISSLRKVGGKIYSSCKDGGVRVYNIADMH